MTALLVALPAPSASPSGAPSDYGYALTADGHQVLVQATAPAAQLPPAPRAGEVVAVLPAEAVSWHRVALPPGSIQSPARTRAVLEGLLEDRLLDDPAALHFALQPGARAGAAAWVAACDRAWLRAHLQALEAAGRPAGRIVPAFAPGAADGEPALDASGVQALHAIGTPGAVGTGRWLAQMADGRLLLLPLHASALAVLAPQGAAGLADVPATAEPACAAEAERQLGRPAQLRTVAEGWLAAARGGWDLAQFEFASSSRRRAARRAGTQVAALWQAPQWRAARWGAGLLVAVQLLGLNAWAWKERRAQEAQAAEIRRTLTTTFPGVRTVVDAPLQMQREVDALRAATGAATARDFDVVLAQVAAVLPAGRSAAAVDWSNGTLLLRGLNLSTDEAADITTRLRTQGLAATADGDNALRIATLPTP